MSANSLSAKITTEVCSHQGASPQEFLTDFLASRVRAANNSFVDNQPLANTAIAWIKQASEAKDKFMTDGESGNGQRVTEREPSPTKSRSDYGEIEAALGYSFVDQNWLERALTHRSLHPKGNKSDYERLEFLGDAVLDLAVAHLLLDVHAEAREGELSKMRAALVNTVSLADIARKINLGPFIRLSRGELASGGSERSSILADVLEAVIGAVYREAGFTKALAVSLTLFGDQIRNVMPRDPKTELQEVLHAKAKEAPKYLLECVEGPEHAPTFISVVVVNNQICGRGKGATKKASQQEAASEALTKFKTAELSPPAAESPCATPAEGQP